MSGAKLWAEWLERDDRSWVKALRLREWSPEMEWDRLSPLALSIVTSLDFGRYSRRGVSPQRSVVEDRARQFLVWMARESEWSRIEKRWGQSEGPRSLPLAMSRAYLRFRLEKGWVTDEPSYAGTRNALDFSLASMVPNLTEGILEAFSKAHEGLPEPLRIPYQLYLEGLLPSEISALMGVTESKVQKAIAEAKKIMTEDTNYRRSA